MHGQRELAHLHRNQQRSEIVGIGLGLVETYARNHFDDIENAAQVSGCQARFARLAARSAMALEAFANCPLTPFTAPEARSLSFESTLSPFLNFRYNLGMMNDYVNRRHGAAPGMSRSS